MSKSDLLAELHRRGMALNAAARELFAEERFKTSEVCSVVETLELPVAMLGLQQGAFLSQIQERAAAIGLPLCPLELGPHLRLQYLDQPEGYLGQPASQHRAPPGAVTVASRPIAEDDDIPKGFYLRRITGVLWLRGYRAAPEHLWSPDDRFLFIRPAK